MFGDISEFIEITGVVNTGVVGIYQVAYNVTNPNGLVGTTFIRNVNVSTRPVITLHGPETVAFIPGTRYLPRDMNDADHTNIVPPAQGCGTAYTTVNGVGCFGDDYYDDGNGNWSDVTATDAEDGDITATVEIVQSIIETEYPRHRKDLPPSSRSNPDTGALDLQGELINWVGDYVITYRATDSSGLAAVPVTRLIQVREPENLPAIPKPKAEKTCFISTASQNASGTMLIPLSGLAIFGLAGCFRRRR